MADSQVRCARKPYRCSLCGRRLPKGQKYTYVRLTPWDHPDNEGFSTWRVHSFCWEAWAKAGHEWDYTEPDWSEFRQIVPLYFYGREGEFPWAVAAEPEEG